MKYTIEQLSRKKKPIYSLRAQIAVARRLSGIRTQQIYRNEFMRDRDRILYSKSFRRLSGKTQVYLSGVDDHKRTRLTHTLEVSQIARSISSALNLDPDLTEAIALGHDLGHTPYGHVGERTLHEIMTPHFHHELGESCPLNITNNENSNNQKQGITDKYSVFLGFKHNLQSLKNAMELEKNYGNFGLDLTNFTLFGLQFHSRKIYKEGNVINHDKLTYYDQFVQSGCMLDDGEPAWSFEAFVVAEADEIAQRHHDVEDAIRGNLVSKDEITKMILNKFKDYLKPKEKKELKSAYKQDEETFIALISRILVNMFVTNLVQASVVNINLLIYNEQINRSSFVEFVKNHSPYEDIVRNIISYSSEFKKNDFLKTAKEFQEIITDRVLSSFDIQKSDAKGKYIIKKLFQAFYCNPQQLPNHCVVEYLLKTYPNEYEKEKILSDIEKNGIGKIRSSFFQLINKKEEYTEEKKLILMRVICDYLSGMTDSYANKTYEELYG